MKLKFSNVYELEYVCGTSCSNNLDGGKTLVI